MDFEAKNKVVKSLSKSQNRQELLSKTTGAERAAAKILTAMGVRFVMQQPFYTGQKCFYADIYIPSLRLVLEIDGGYHFTNEQKRKDTNRSAALRRLGVHVCRLTNHDARIPEKVKSKLLRYKRR